ncbi:GGDEF domain-containing protein [Candidatus Kaiserbacteria bacterium]|nr:GGDEF domain-containing protein [Candidatus Kaiserbacteria bacterium]
MSESPKFERPETPETGDETFSLEEKAAMYLERSQHNLEQLEKDRLTGLSNRMGFDRALERELMLRARGGQDCSILFIDLDNFKQVNDSKGHLEGDRVLQEVAEVLTHSIRGTDLVARFGGDEFFILLPQTDKEEALETGNKILTALNGSKELFIGPGITASIGISSSSLSANATELVHFADLAAKKAKQSGKNQVMTFEALGEA